MGGGGLPPFSRKPRFHANKLSVECIPTSTGSSRDFIKMSAQTPCLECIVARLYHS